jgi:hypothetical protein
VGGGALPAKMKQGVDPPLQLAAKYISESVRGYAHEVPHRFETAAQSVDGGEPHQLVTVSCVSLCHGRKATV